MSKQNDYRALAADISASALRVYEYWIGKGLSPRQAFEMAKAAYSDTRKYTMLRREIGV